MISQSESWSDQDGIKRRNVMDRHFRKQLEVQGFPGGRTGKGEKFYMEEQKKKVVEQIKTY